MLREALRKSQKVGLCKFIMRSTEHMGIFKVDDDGILLIQIRFDDKFICPEKINQPLDIKTTQKELDMALLIIDQLTDTFDASKFKDTYKTELIKMIKKKFTEKPGTKEPISKRTEKTVSAKDDLLEQFKVSLAAIKN